MINGESPDICKTCGENIHLEYAGEDMGMLEGASIWEHDRWRSQVVDQHEPYPVFNLLNQLDLIAKLHGLDPETLEEVSA